MHRVSRHHSGRLRMHCRALSIQNPAQHLLNEIMNLPLLTIFLPLLTIATGLIIAGFYVSFTLVVFPALARMDDRSASTFMVHVNRYAQRPPFLSLFFLGLLASAGCLALSIVHENIRISIGAALVLSGALLTIGVNVPLNRRLEQNSLAWAKYEPRWIRANAARALGSSLGAVLLLSGV